MILRIVFASLVLVATCRADVAAEAAQRGRFLTAYPMAKAGLDWEKAAPELASYPLRPYLEHATLMRAPRPDSDAIAAFIAKHGDQPLTRPLRHLLIARRVQVADWQGVLALDLPTLATAERCQMLRAAIELGRTDGLREPALSLWLHPRSLPDACDAVGTWLKREGALDAETVWKRIELAIAAQQIGLTRALAAQLGAKDKAAVLHAADLLADSARARRAAKQWPDDAAHRRALSAAIVRIAARDDAQAATLWREFSPRLAFEDAQKYRVLDAIALYRANSYEADAASWLDLVPAGHDSAATREWRLREALSRHDLVAAEKAVARFDETQLADSRWQYWRARVAELRGQSDKASGWYRELSSSPTFFGFLAAERAKLPYTLCPIDTPLAADQVLAIPGFARAFELLAIGWTTEARREWDAALVGISPETRRAAVALADARGWHDRAPFALNTGDDLRAYALRFPLAHRELVTQSAQRNALSPSVVFGLIRSESAWVQDAKSGANAYGLMQLIPETARRMAKVEKRAFASPQALFDPALNVPLGTRYLSGLMQRYDGAHWLAAAAYNAGPGRVDAWLAARGQLEPDMFVETIPFRETREYVARVLAFAVIYDWRLNGRAFSLDYALKRSDGTPPPVRRAVGCPVAQVATTR